MSCVEAWAGSLPASLVWAGVSGAAASAFLFDNQPPIAVGPIAKTHSPECGAAGVL